MKIFSGLKANIIRTTHVGFLKRSYRELMNLQSYIS